MKWNIFLDQEEHIKGNNREEVGPLILCPRLESTWNAEQWKLEHFNVIFKL